MNRISANTIIYILLVIYSVLLVSGILFFDGTGDAGDSVLHYLFARYAPAHPELYFDHWAKPVFVLLASPFAQFGFTGIKTFNAIATVSTVFITTKIANQLQLKNAWLCAVIMMFAPLYYILTLSGLTEPLFALFTALGIYYCLRGSVSLACMLISFLPYVRSEGLIIIGVFALYLLVKGKWKSTPLLLTGSAVYSVAGFYVYHDLLWVFTRIPYASAHSVYGSGPLFHFVEQLVNVTGVPIYMLFWVGLLSQIYYALKRKTTYEESILVVSGFLAFFLAHTLFWYLGIFNSMGLKRVLLCVMPMIGIIALLGYNQITEVWLIQKSALRKVTACVIIAYIVIFPFTPNPSAIQWEKDLRLSGEQRMANDLADILKKNSAETKPIMYNSYCISMALNSDPFDPQQKINFSKENVHNLKRGQIVIWENKESPSETTMSQPEIENDTSLNKVRTLKGLNNGKEKIYLVFVKK